MIMSFFAYEVNVSCTNMTDTSVSLLQYSTDGFDIGLLCDGMCQ